MRTPDDPSIHQVSAACRPSDFVSQGKANASQCNARSLLLPPRPPSSPSNHTSNQEYTLLLASHTELHNPQSKQSKLRPELIFHGMSWIS